jgi:UDP-2,3-diacylglucosamine pyrophosphatase LpxH
MESTSIYKIPVKRLVISDVHLGSGYTRVKGLLETIHRYDFKELILCGDILDFWRMRYKIKWHGDAYAELIEDVLEIAKTKRVIYIPGNHDEYLRQFVGQKVFGMFILNQYIADDTLFIHGDQFDNLSEDQKVFYYIGDFAYNAVQRTNHLLKWPLSVVLRDPFAVSKVIKRVGKRVFSHLNGFYDNAAEYTHEQSCGRVVCGHTHISEKKTLDKHGIVYYNCGDWVESGTAIIQYSTGCLEIIDYDETYSNK